MLNYYPRLRDLREDRDLSQQQVAEFLDMKQPQYNRYERGFRDVPTDILIRLAGLYQTSVDYILGLTDQRQPYARNDTTAYPRRKRGDTVTRLK